MLAREQRNAINVLDFGCGYGYVALHLAGLQHPQVRVYACDCDEECLDVLWGRIAQRQLNNVTAFHLPNYSQIYLPAWLPTFDYVFCSFSMSALEHPDIALPQLVQQMAPGTQFFLVDWDPEKSHPQLDIFVPPAKRILAADFRHLIEYSGLHIDAEETGKNVYYHFRAHKPSPSNRG